MAVKSAPTRIADKTPRDSEVPAKDHTEEELERLVFGNTSTFSDALKLHNHDLEGEQTGQEHETGQDDRDLGAVQDADLFFIDAGAADPARDDDATPVSLVQRQEDEASSDESAEESPAWEDSDDERLVVSLATDTRLRKLRKFDGEDLVSGKEYIKRLRRQFERLNPRPEWLRYATTHGPSGKRRKTSEWGDDMSADGEEFPGDDMDVDEELSAQPLAKLLRNTGELMRTSDDNKSGRKRRKFRPEVLDIQKTRDIPGVQPSAITSLQFHPQYPILLSAGPASTLFLHRVSPSDSANPNPLLTSLHIRHSPIATVAFHLPDGGRIFAAGQRRHFHIWDLPSGTIEKVTRVQGHADEQRPMARFKLSPCGRWMGVVGARHKGGVGVITILDARTTQWVGEARVGSHGGIADFCWWRDGEGLTIAGKSGDMVEFNMRQRRTVAQWMDEGAVGTTVIALGGGGGGGSGDRRRSGNASGGQPLGGDRWIAVGSSSGIINIYDRWSWTASADHSTNHRPTTDSPSSAAVSQTPPVVNIPARPKPLKTIENLTTATSHLVFSPDDGQLLAIGSRWKRDALRLVHLPSCTVYRNWPTAGTPLGRITAVAFCPYSLVSPLQPQQQQQQQQSQQQPQLLLAVANEAGKIRLWEIR